MTKGMLPKGIDQIFERGFFIKPVDASIQVSKEAFGSFFRCCPPDFIINKSLCSLCNDSLAMETMPSILPSRDFDLCSRRDPGWPKSLGKRERTIIVLNYFFLVCFVMLLVIQKSSDEITSSE